MALRYTINTLSDIKQANFQQRLKLLKTFSFIIMGVDILGFVLAIVAAFLVQELDFISLSLEVIIFLSAVGSYFLAKQEKLVSGGWLLIIPFTSAVAFVYYKPSIVLYPTYTLFLIPIGMSAVLLGFRAVSIVSVTTILFTVGNLIRVGFLEPYATHYGVHSSQLLASVNIFMVLIVVPGFFATIGLPFWSQGRMVERQNAQLLELVKALQQRQETIETVSHEVQGLATGLKSSAYEQDATSREQATSVQQVNSSLKELYATANHIAIASQQVNEAAENMNNVSLGIEEVSRTSTDYNQQGLEAIERTTSTSREIASLYNSLLTVLNELNTKSSNMRQILQLLKNITNQTHLLALNASIEAAGAGEYGDRFAVVAQEVKELANNASHARERVEKDVSDIEETTANAVQAVRVGYEKARQLEKVNEEMQAVFQNIFEISADVQLQSNSICNVAQNVKELTETVRLATTQQRSATEQILVVLENLSLIAQQNAASSQQVASTVQQLEGMSEQLVATLAA